MFRKNHFVATATAIALFVDGARVPVYLASEWRGILDIWPLVLTATVAVVVGTAVGTRVLEKIPDALFRKVVGALLTVLGIYLVIPGRA